MPYMKRAQGIPSQWSLPELAVTVQQLASTEFSWKLMRRRNGHPPQCIAEGSAPFLDFDQALESGFVALKAAGGIA